MLNETLLHRLITDGLNTFLSSAPGYQSRACNGASLVLCGEPVADLNYLSIHSVEPAALAAAREFMACADKADLPFIAAVAESAVEQAGPVCDAAGLMHVTAWPLMVCEGNPAGGSDRDDVTIWPVESQSSLLGVAEVLSEAFSMPPESVLTVMPMALYDSPSITTLVAEQGGEINSTVTVTRHGDVRGIWAMGTRNGAQGKGIGKALLMDAMQREVENGARAFFLGATPSGLPLYEKLGYRTVSTAQVWVRGETNQS